MKLENPQHLGENVGCLRLADNNCGIGRIVVGGNLTGGLNGM